MKRDFEIYLNTGDEVREFFRDAAGILEQVGGILQVGAIRDEVSPAEYVTVGVRVHWDSFMPAVAKPEPAELTDSEPVED